MGNLLTYSGLTTKIRAMQNRLISEDEFAHMGQLKTVPECVSFLRQYPTYVSLFDEGTDLHRGAIEHQLGLSLYRDFEKLYRFSGAEQKAFLRLYFLHYEVIILKSCLRYVMGGSREGLDTPELARFFNRFSKISFERILYAKTLYEFGAALEKSPYRAAFQEVEKTGSRRGTDYESALDMKYFKLMWKTIQDMKDQQEKNSLMETFGTKIDLLNLEWIERSIKYYHLSAAQIAALLIPIRYRLKKEEIAKLTAAADQTAFEKILAGGHYEHREGMLEEVYQMSFQKAPYSVAALNTYLYQKEREIEKIVHTIESVRYGVKRGDGRA